MKSRFLRLKFATGSEEEKVIPQFRQEDVFGIARHRLSFKLKILGPSDTSLIKISEVVDYFDYLFYDEMLEWEFTPCTSCPPGEMISILLFERKDDAC